MTQAINTFFIRIISLGAPLLRMIGVKMPQLKTILRTKCTVDDRRPLGLNMYRKSKRSSGWMKNITLLLLGSFICVTLFIDNPLMAHTLYFSAVMIYLTSSLLNDFSDVLIDVRDHYFIVSRPVNDQTVAAARILHILIYLSKIFIPLVLPGLLVAFISGGIFSGFIFFVQLGAAVSICVFAVHIIYLLLLQLISPQTFRDVLAYFQIGFAILIFAGYIIFPRLLEHSDIINIDPTLYTASYFLPPVWIATLHNWTIGSISQTTYLFSTLALLVPTLCLAGTVKFLSGDLNNKLSLMGAADESNEDTATDNQSISERIAGYVTTSPLERLGFKITWKLSSRMREFKLRVYPAFAYIPIYFIYIVFIQDSDLTFAEQWHQLPQSSYYLFVLYLMSFIAMVTVGHTARSKKYQAAWFYQITPSKNPGHVLAGMVKAVFIKYVLPATLVATAFVLWIWGFSKWLNIVFALINIVLITLAMALIDARKFPFSTPAGNSENKGNSFLKIGLMLVPVALGFFQSFISSYPRVLIGLSILYLIIIGALYRVYRNISWDELLGE